MNISTGNSFGITHGALPSSIKNGFDDETSSESSSDIYSDTSSDTSSEVSNRGFHAGSATPLSSQTRRRVTKLTSSLTKLSSAIKEYVEKRREEREIDFISDYVSLEEISRADPLSDDDVSEFDTESDEDGSVYGSAMESRYVSEFDKDGSVYESARASVSESEPLRPLEDIIKERNVNIYEEPKRRAKMISKLDKLAKQQPYRIISFFRSIGRSFCSIFEKISSVYTNNRFQPPSPGEQQCEILYPYHPKHVDVIAERLGDSPFSRENSDVPQSWFEEDMTQIRYATLEEIEKRVGPFEKV